MKLYSNGVKRIIFIFCFSGLFLQLVFSCNKLDVEADDKDQCEEELSDTSLSKIDFLIRELNKPVSCYIMVAAHRGYWKDAPENSIPAIWNAIKIGVDIVEFDLQKTKDGILILMHDETLDRTTTGNGEVEDYYWEDLQKLSLTGADGEVTQYRIPTFEEAMLLIKREKKVLVNVDNGDLYLEEVGKVLKKTGTSNLAIIKSSKAPETIKNSIHHIDESFFMPVIHCKSSSTATLEIVESYRSAFKSEVFEISFNEETSTFYVNALSLTKKNIKMWVTTTSPKWCGGHGDEVAVDNNNPEASWGWLIKKGATIVLTNNPAELIKYLETKGFRKTT